MRATVIAHTNQQAQQEQAANASAYMQPPSFATMSGSHGAAAADTTGGQTLLQSAAQQGPLHNQPQPSMMYSFAPQHSFMHQAQPMMAHGQQLRPQAQQTSPAYPFSAYAPPSTSGGGAHSPTSLGMPPNPFTSQSSYLFNPAQPQLTSAAAAASMQYHPSAGYVMQPQPQGQQQQSSMQHPQQPAPMRFQPAPHSIYSSMASMNVSGQAQSLMPQQLGQPQMQHMQFASQIMQPTSAQQHQALVQQQHQQNQLYQHQMAQHQINLQQQQHQQQMQLFNMQSKVKSEQDQRQLSPSQMMLQESPMSSVPMYPLAVRAVNPSSPIHYSPNSLMTMSPNAMRATMPALGANVMQAPGVMHPILNAKTVVRATLVTPIHTGAESLSRSRGNSAPQAPTSTTKKPRRSSASTTQTGNSTTQHSPMLPASATASQWSSEADDDDRSHSVQSSDEQQDDSDPEHSMSEEEPDSGDEYDDDGDAPTPRKPRRDGSRPPLMRKTSRAGESVPADQQSVIVCGVATSAEPNAPRRFMEDSKYFGAHVDVYTALDDPKQRTLFRASALAHKFHVATNQVGMYLVRRRHQGHVQGLYQATAFQSKPAGRTGLKAGGYFVSMDLCLQFEAYMSQHSKHNRYRARGLVRQSGRRGPAPLSSSEPYHPRPSQHRASQAAKAAKAKAAAEAGLATASSSAASSVSAHSPVPSQRSVKAAAASEDLARVLVDCALVMERRASH